MTKRKRPSTKEIEEAMGKPIATGQLSKHEIAILKKNLDEIESGRLVKVKVSGKIVSVLAIHPVGIDLFVSSMQDGFLHHWGWHKKLTLAKDLPKVLG